MKRALLLMVVSALLVTLGFAQTPAGGTTDPANVKGCLGGSDGSYTVAEDGTRQIIKISTSIVDLKPHVGHDVKLTGHKSGGTVSSGAADSSFAVTELSMISEHCAAAAAATVGAVVPYSQTVIEPTTTTPSPNAPASTAAVEAAAPAATVSPSSSPATPAAEAVAPTPAVETAAPPAATVSPSAAPASTPTVEAAAAAAISPAAAQVSTPPAEATVPAATVSPSAAVSGPSEKATHSARRPSAPRRLSATQDTAAAPAATVSPKAADAATTVSPSPEVSPAGADAASASPSATTVTPDAAATLPAVTHRTGSLTLLISFVVLVIVLGTLIPFIGRWRKRKMLEQTGTPNLSFTNEASTNDASPTVVRIDEASSDQHKPEPSKVA